MATAREVRSRVRQQMAEQIAAREGGALAVAAAWERRIRAQERLEEADREVGRAVTDSLRAMALGDLAMLSGVRLADLRRVVRSERRSPDAPESKTTSRPDDVSDTASEVVAEPDMVSAGAPLTAVPMS